MSLDLDAVGRKTEPFPLRWTSKDALIYALGIGAGADDPLKELAFTTENTTGLPQRVLPTFAVALGFDAPRPQYGEIDRSKSVHAEQSLRTHRPFPADGRGVLVRTIDGIYDKGSGALVSWKTEIFSEDGGLLVELSTGAFIRGAGGFGGDRGPKSSFAVPERGPDLIVEQQTRRDQALLYRLSGDRNPLHSDPKFAQLGGWPRPILHGLCTFGFVGRALLGLVDQDPDRLKAMKVRFTAPVLPGDRLTTSIWRDGGQVVFRTAVGDRLVLDAGQAEIEA